MFSSVTGLSNLVDLTIRVTLLCSARVRLWVCTAGQLRLSYLVESNEICDWPYTKAGQQAIGMSRSRYFHTTHASHCTVHWRFFTPANSVPGLSNLVDLTIRVTLLCSARERLWVCTAGQLRLSYLVESNEICDWPNAQESLWFSSANFHLVQCREHLTPTLDGTPNHVYRVVHIFHLETCRS